MIIYSVTVNVETSIEDQWVKWMKDVHIPEVMDTKYFVENRFCKVLMEHPEGGINYSIQYLCNTMKDLQLYQAKHAPELQKKHTDMFGEKTIGFRTILEMV